MAEFHLVVVSFFFSFLKVTSSEDTSWPKHVDNKETSQFARFVWLLCQN